MSKKTNKISLSNGWLIFLPAVILMLPYQTLGNGLGNVILMFLGTIFLIWQKEKIKLNRNFLIILSILLIFALFSLFRTNNMVNSLNGFSLYINALLFFVIFSRLAPLKEKTVNIMVFIISITSLVFIVFQGVILKERIDGNLGYANTYALILLLGLYLNEIRKYDLFSFWLQLPMTLGIIYTGSRNTFLYLFVFFIAKTYFDWKKENRFTGLFGFFLSLALYISFQYLGIIIVLIAPVILYLGYVILQKQSVRTKNYLFLAFSLILITAVLLTGTNSIERVKNISLQSGVLQERLVFFADATKHIIKNPLGSGIDSFAYRQYKDQTAFYDVRYIHNSLLQVAYDLGILPMLIFLALIIYGGLLISKNKSSDKKYYLLIYISIFLHSLLDFDFSIASTFILLVMIVASQAADSKTGNIKYKPGLYITIPVMVIAIYLLSYGSIVAIGNTLEQNAETNQAKSWYNFAKNITWRNPDINLKLAQNYMEEGNTKASINALKSAQAINPNEVKATGNLAFSYEKLGDDKNTIFYYYQMIEKVKFDYSIYQLYYNYLNQRYNDTTDIKYKEEMDKLRETYTRNQKRLNPRAKYMNNQMPVSFDDMLKLKMDK